MYSDPKECLYCTNNQTQKDLMIQFAELRVSRAFLFKEQTYRGRCLVAYNGHVNYSDKLSHLHFHLAPKYVDGPDYGGTFQMNPGKVYLSDAEYQELIDQIKAEL